MKVRAVYKGVSGFFGYVHGKAYTLLIYDNQIQRIEGDGICKYGSIQSFASKWLIIEHLD